MNCLAPNYDNLSLLGVIIDDYRIRPYLQSKLGYYSRFHKLFLARPEAIGKHDIV